MPQSQWRLFEYTLQTVLLQSVQINAYLLAEIAAHSTRTLFQQISSFPRSPQAPSLHADSYGNYFSPWPPLASEYSCGAALASSNEPPAYSECPPIPSYPGWHSPPPPSWTPTSHEPYAAEVQPAYNDETCYAYCATGYAAPQNDDPALVDTEAPFPILIKTRSPTLAPTHTLAASLTTEDPPAAQPTTPLQPPSFLPPTLGCQPPPDFYVEGGITRAPPEALWERRSTTPASTVYTAASLPPSDERDDDDYSDSSAPVFYTSFESNSFAALGDLRATATDVSCNEPFINYDCSCTLPPPGFTLVQRRRHTVPLGPRRHAAVNLPAGGPYRRRRLGTRKHPRGRGKK